MAGVRACPAAKTLCADAARLGEQIRKDMELLVAEYEQPTGRHTSGGEVVAGDRK
jgi:hypothetical protein